MVDTHLVNECNDVRKMSIDDWLPVGLAVGESLGVAEGVNDGVFEGAKVGLLVGKGRFFT